MQYPITTDYVSSWGERELLREVFQNAIDNGEFHYTIDGETLAVVSPNTIINKTALLFGYSNKAAGAIGKFGEGLKLAMLVAARLGLPFKVFTGRQIWEPRLASKYGQQILDVKTSHRIHKSPDTIIQVTGVDLEAYLPYNLHLSNQAHLTVLTDRPGEIFTGGLWVCKVPDMKYGYNIPLSLDRDRAIASEFDVSWATSVYWSKQPDEAVKLVEEGVKDVQYMHSVDHGPVRLKLKERLGDRIVVSSQEEFEQFSGRAKIIFGSTSYANMMQEYRPALKPKLEDILCPKCRLAVNKWRL